MTANNTWTSGRNVEAYGKGWPDVGGTHVCQKGLGSRESEFRSEAGEMMYWKFGLLDYNMLRYVSLFL
jgi:hypothetical protein